jgi:two-component system chemotaxis sensor kinase CheA
VNNSEVLRLRGRLLPLINLSEALGISEHSDNSKDVAKYIAVCEQGTMKYGLIVDRIFDTEEIVVKPVSSALRSITLYSGSTILGDGSVVMILDPNGLAKSINIRASQQDDEVEHKVADEDKPVPFLLFKAGDGAPKAVPLEIVSRLEEVANKDVEKAGNIKVVQYRGDLMRLTKLDDSYDFSNSETRNNSVLVFNEGEKVLGLVVEQIIDIVSEKVDIEILWTAAHREVPKTIEPLNKMLERLCKD